jgi:fumarate hydratase class II
MLKGLNTFVGFDERVCAQIGKDTGLPFIPAENKVFVLLLHLMIRFLFSLIVQ